MTAPPGAVVNASCVAGPTVTLNATLSTEVSPLAVAVSWYAVPARLMARPGKVATPLIAATVRVPDSVAPAVPVLPVIAIVTLFVALVTVLPSPSVIAICTAEANGTPPVVSAGGVTTTSFVAAPCATSNGALSAGASPAAVAARR